MIDFVSSSLHERLESVSVFNERTAMIKEVLLCLCLTLAPAWTAPVQTGKYYIAF